MCPSVFEEEQSCSHKHYGLTSQLCMQLEDAACSEVHDRRPYNGYDSPERSGRPRFMRWCEMVPSHFRQIAFPSAAADLGGSARAKGQPTAVDVELSPVAPRRHSNVSCFSSLSSACERPFGSAELDTDPCMQWLHMFTPPTSPHLARTVYTVQQRNGHLHDILRASKPALIISGRSYDAHTCHR